MSRPTDDPDFATNANFAAGSDPWSGQPNKVRPASGIIASGIVPATDFPAEWFNYFQDLNAKWISYMDIQRMGGYAGDGSDGAVTVNGGTTTLTQALNATSIHVTSTGILNVANFPVFCQGAITIDAGGIISCDGAAGASGASGGAAGAAIAAGVLAGGGSGGAGHVGAGGSAGTGTSNALGGGGGAGGAGDLGTWNGGGGGFLGLSAGNNHRNVPAILHGANIDARNSPALVPIQTGTGGGGGGGGNTSGNGGGGGAGGGHLILVCYNLVNNGTIRALGGPGGAGQGGGLNGGGGGGGGGGGLVVLFYVLTSGTGTVSVAGGVHGSGGGAGSAGADGGAGRIITVLG